MTTSTRDVLDDRTFQRRIAVYVWCSEHHSGAASREYRLMSRLSRAGVYVGANAWSEINGTADVDPDRAEWSEGRERYVQLCEAMNVGCNCAAILAEGCAR
jgi:hypothetical protein